MKSTIVALLALACVFGLATAQFGYGYAPSKSSGGFGSLLPLLLLLILLPLLFNNNDNQGDTTIIFSNYSGPTGGK